MEKLLLHVAGMSCSHCVNAITKSVGSLDGVTEVQVDLGEKTVAVSYDGSKVTPGNIKDEIEDQGYEIVPS